MNLRVHLGTPGSAVVTLTSAAADDSYTCVTVGNAGADGNGVSITGGNTAVPAFTCVNSDSRTLRRPRS